MATIFAEEKAELEVEFRCEQAMGFLIKTFSSIIESEL